MNCLQNILIATCIILFVTACGEDTVKSRCNTDHQSDEPAQATPTPSIGDTTPEPDDENKPPDVVFPSEPEAWETWECRVYDTAFSVCGDRKPGADTDEDGIEDAADDYPLCHSSVQGVGADYIATHLLLDLCLANGWDPERPFAEQARTLGIITDADAPLRYGHFTRGQILLFVTRALTARGVQLPAVDDVQWPWPWADIFNGPPEHAVAAFQLFLLGHVQPCESHGGLLRLDELANGPFLWDAEFDDHVVPPPGAARTDDGQPLCDFPATVCCPEP